MELKEAIKILKEKQDALNSHIKNYEESDCLTNVYYHLVEEKEAIDTVLQVLENKDVTNKYINMI